MFVLNFVLKYVPLEKEIAYKHYSNYSNSRNLPSSIGIQAVIALKQLALWKACEIWQLLNSCSMLKRVKTHLVLQAKINKRVRKMHDPNLCNMANATHAICN